MSSQSSFQFSANPATNPFLLALPPEMNFAEIAAWLSADPPLGPWHWGEVPANLSKLFIATRQSIDICRRLLSMMRNSLTERDPRGPRWRQELGRLGEAKMTKRKLELLPWRDSYAAAAVLEGIPGVGKSHIVNRFMELLPQRIEIPADPQAGMHAITQLVYIRLYMPADASPNAFCDQAFLAIDQALGTDYSDRYVARHGLTASQRLIFLIHTLQVHGCGMVFLEECQTEVFTRGPQAKIFQNIFLRFLNSGIPTVLLGPTAGVAWAKDVKAGNERRVGLGGWFQLNPILSWQDTEWAEEWMSFFWTVTCLPEPDSVWCDQATLSRTVWEYSGGDPGYLLILRSETLRAAIDSGARCVQSGHFIEALSSAPYRAILTTAKGLATRDIGLLGREDIDASSMRQIWRDHDHSRTVLTSVTKQTPSHRTEVSPGRLEQNATSEDLPTENNLVRKRRPKKTLDPNSDQPDKSLANVDYPPEDYRSEEGRARLSRGE